MVEMGIFLLYNHGKLPIYVDGKTLLNSCKTHVYDKSIIEVKIDSKSIILKRIRIFKEFKIFQIGDFAMLFLLNYNRMQPIVEQLSLLTNNC